MSGEVLIRISEGYTCHAEGSDFCSCFQVQDIEVVLTGCPNRKLLLNQQPLSYKSCPHLLRARLRGSG